MSQAVYGVDSTGRSVMLQAAKATNYSVANPHTLAAVRSLLLTLSSGSKLIALTSTDVRDALRSAS